ncbi:MAG: sulfotransferase [Anaerolineales bacterium]|nr:MAG: sulfotransferase [Anaerolineales bacterium]
MCTPLPLDDGLVAQRSTQWTSDPARIVGRMNRDMIHFMSQAPIFIVGCGRSGTTLLRNFIHAHPEIAIPPESLFIIDYLRAAGHSDIHALIRLILGEPEIREWGLSLRLVDLEDCKMVPQVIERLHLLYAHSMKKRRWGQKTPRFIRHLELLGNHFPEAKFIHLIRDPRAVANSLIRSDVHRSTPYHAAKRWMMDVGAGLAYEQAFPERIMRIRYEDLVSRPEDTLTSVFGFLEMDYYPYLLHNTSGDADYSKFYENIHANLNRPVSADHVKRWTTELSPGAIETIEIICAELMERMGYEPVSASISLKEIDVNKMKAQRVTGVFLQAFRYFRYRRSYLPYLLYRKFRLGLLRDFLWTVNY